MSASRRTVGASVQPTIEQPFYALDQKQIRRNGTHQKQVEAGRRLHEAEQRPSGVSGMSRPTSTAAIVSPVSTGCGRLPGRARVRMTKMTSTGSPATR